MTISKESTVDLITVTQNGIVQYREVISFIENGIVTSKTYHRTSLTPGQDLSGQPDNVVAVAKASWTPEIIEDFRKSMEKK